MNQPCELTLYCRQIGNSELLFANAGSPFELLGEFLWAGVGRSTAVCKMYREGREAILEGREQLHQIVGDSFQALLDAKSVEIIDIYDTKRSLKISLVSFFDALDAWESAIEKYRKNDQRSRVFPSSLTLSIEVVCNQTR